MSRPLTFLPLSDLVAKAADRIKNPPLEAAENTGMATGYDAFDAATMGLQPGELIILAGRPGMGKTTLALNIAKHISVHNGANIAFFSLETPAHDCTQRLLSSSSRINQTALRSGKLDSEDWPRLTSSISLLGQSKIFFDETQNLSINELIDRCNHFSQEHRLGLVIIDYLQLMQLPGSKDHPAAGYEELLRSLKALAKQLTIPVVVVSQIRSGLEMRGNKRPCVRDVCEFDAFEHYADMTLMLYRDEFYNPGSPDKGIVELSYMHRNQCLQGMIKLQFSAECFRFDTMQTQEQKET